MINAADGKVNENVPFILRTLNNDEDIEDILPSVV